jgi:pimeloyl-ACP methyl ester carboxylesterase
MYHVADRLEGFMASIVYSVLRNQLGSIRRVYLRGNRIIRRDDFAEPKETVLLLHGFFQTRNIWEVMEDRLRHDGYGVLSFDLGGLLWRFNTRSISDLAEMVSQKIERLCEKHGIDRVHIVGHSKGGLVARAYIQRFGGDRRTKSLITLGTPHHGTPTALIGVMLMGGGVLSRSPLQMLPGSPLLRRLQDEHFPAGIPLASVYSKNDVICPWWCSVLRPRAGESSMQNFVVKGVGHSELTSHSGVYFIVRHELEAASALWQERSA